MSCHDKNCGYPIKPAPFAPADPGPCGPCGPGPCGPHHPPMPPRPPVPCGPCGPCPPSQYIGSRYVPIFADPLEWDINKSYESLTIVTHNNESYTSRCNVGPGIDITNERYWAKTGAYNAQVEQYRNEVKDLSSQVTGFASDNAEFREKIDQYDKDNAAMKNTVAENTARVDALAERVSTAETEIDGLQATTAQHTTELADLHAKDEDLQRQITSNDNDIAALQAKDTEQDSRLDGIDTKLKSHDASLAQNTADIAKNTKNIQDNAANIALNAHELADHAEQLKDHEARLTAQHKEITDNHTAIERNTSDISSLRADLTEDEAKIEANRDAIAHIQEKDVQQDALIGDWATAHPGQTIAECATSQENELTEHAGTLAQLETDKADKTDIFRGEMTMKVPLYTGTYNNITKKLSFILPNVFPGRTVTNLSASLPEYDGIRLVGWAGLNPSVGGGRNQAEIFLKRPAAGETPAVSITPEVSIDSYGNLTVTIDASTMTVEGEPVPTSLADETANDSPVTPDTNIYSVIVDYLMLVTINGDKFTATSQNHIDVHLTVS